MEIVIDRSLPVTIAAQVQGQIEYGVAFGAIAPGSRLPSVRELAQQLEVSPVTVAHVYRALRERGVLVSRPGSGTFVHEDAVLGNAAEQGLVTIRTMLDSLMQTAHTLGLTRADLKRLISLQLDGEGPESRGLRLAFVGNFAEATRDYVRELLPYVRPYLRPDGELRPLTIDDLRADTTKLARLREADVIITLAHRVPEVRRLLEPNAAVTVLDFIPSETTRTTLAELAAGTRIGLMSTYAEFLTPLKQRVLAFAPHVEVVRATVADAPNATDVGAHCDVVVYTTGAESVALSLAQQRRCIEFRYSPDPHSVRTGLLRLLGGLRPGVRSDAMAAVHGA